jgi:chromosome segregation ATPase
MPRKSNEEMIAELEAKLAKAKETAVERVQSTKDKLKEKRATLVVRRGKIDDQIKDVDDEIAKLDGNDSFTSAPADEV